MSRAAAPANAELSGAYSLSGQEQANAEADLVRESAYEECIRQLDAGEIDLERAVIRLRTAYRRAHDIRCGVSGPLSPDFNKEM